MIGSIMSTGDLNHLGFPCKFCGQANDGGECPTLKQFQDAQDAMLSDMVEKIISGKASEWAVIVQTVNGGRMSISSQNARPMIGSVYRSLKD